MGIHEVFQNKQDKVSEE